MRDDQAIVNIEANFVGSFFFAPELYQIFEFDPDIFISQQHHFIYLAIGKLIENKISPDAVVVGDQLTKDGNIEKAGGVKFVYELANSQFYLNSSATAQKKCEHYWNILREEYQLRVIRSIGRQMMEAEDRGEVSELVTKIVMSSNEIEKPEITITEAMAKMLDSIERFQNHKGDLVGVSSGVKVIDNAIGGYQSPDLNIIAARSKHGKTAFMMNAVARCPDPVGIISGEQPAEQLAMRVTALSQDINLHAMRLGKLVDQDFLRINSAISEFHNRKIYIYDKGQPNISSIEATARAWVYKYGIKVLWVDYIQLVKGGEGRDKHNQIGDVAARLKGLAKDLNISVNALAQVPRDIDKRSEGNHLMGRMPYQADISDSAQIENLSDTIMTIYRPEVYWPKDQSIKGKVFFNFCKNRHGPEGIEIAKWEGQYTKISEWVEGATEWDEF